MMNRALTTRVICGLVAAAALAVGVTPASAGTYSVNACPMNTGYANNSWVYSSNDPTAFTYANNCQSGGSQQAEALDTRNTFNIQTVFGFHGASRSASLIFTSPSGTTISQLIYNRHLQVFNDDFWTVSTKADSTTLEACSTAPMTVVCNVGSQAGVINIAGLHASNLSINLTCSSANCDGGGSSHSASVAIRSASVTINDPTNPTANAVTGPLASGSDLTGNQQVTVGGSDITGIRNVDVLVDGSIVASANNSCDFTYTRPCAQTSPAFSSTLTVNTAALANGSHTLVGRVYDAAGNFSSSTNSFTVKHPVVPPPIVPPAQPPATPPAAAPKNPQLRLRRSSQRGKKVSIKGSINSRAVGSVRVKLRWTDRKKKRHTKTYTAKRSRSSWTLSRSITGSKIAVSVAFVSRSPAWASVSYVSAKSVKKTRHK